MLVETTARPNTQSIALVEMLNPPPAMATTVKSTAATTQATVSVARMGVFSRRVMRVRTSTAA